MAVEGLEITRHEHPDHGEYRAHLPGTDATGRLTWTALGGVRIAESTFVPSEFRGQGIASELVRAMVDDAQSQGFTIEPQCSYAAAMFRENPAWASLRAPMAS